MVDTILDNFARYYVGLHSTGGDHQLVRQLTERGFATLDGILNRDSLLSLTRQFVGIVRHRDSDADGVTVISGHDGETAPGFAGFGRGELLPHTEGSSLPRPPSLLVLTCVGPAVAGGESFVVDGKALYETLAVEFPDALCALSAQRSAYFGASTGHLGSVFEETESDRVALRVRLDELGRFAPDAAHALTRLRELISRYRIEFRMSAGHGYALQNGRWLHGRGPFSGHREMLRVLGHPMPGIPIHYGFTPSIDTPPPPP